MNYTTIYNNIISNAVGRTKKPGLERHHIIPKSCGGTNTPNNLVILTTREHFICHMLLVKIYANDQIKKKKMIYALWWMCKTRDNINGYRITSHTYENARNKFIEHNPNKCEEKKKKFIENHKLGKYNYDYEKVSNTLKTKLALLSKEQLTERMKNSALSGDPVKRAEAIKRGKGSQYKLTTLSGEIVFFWTYDDVKSITGYSRSQLLYRLNRYNGILENGNKLEYIIRYTGNDKNIGRARNRNNSI
jgi:hypothetical protein